MVPMASLHHYSGGQMHTPYPFYYRSPSRTRQFCRVTTSLFSSLTACLPKRKKRRKEEEEEGERRGRRRARESKKNGLLLKIDC